METESVKSERSSRSHRSRNSNTVNSRSRRSKRSEMAPFQTSVNLTNDDSHGHGQEVIEVQILPQDENWGAETHITGNTSDQSISMEDISNWPTNSAGSIACQKHMERIFSLLLCMAAFCSPILMALLPKLGFFPSTFQNEELNQLTKMQLLACNAECKGKFYHHKLLIKFLIHSHHSRFNCDAYNTPNPLGNWIVGCVLPSTQRRYASNLLVPLDLPAPGCHLNLLVLAFLHRSSD